MVLRIEPLAKIIDGILAGAPPDERRRIVLTSASGPRFDHADAQAFAAADRLVLICGHYEGIDERLSRLYPIEERSLGDLELTGGEIPALAFIDAAVRLIDGVIAPESRAAESFVSGELPTIRRIPRPPVFRGSRYPTSCSRATTLPSPPGAGSVRAIEPSRARQKIRRCFRKARAFARRNRSCPRCCPPMLAARIPVQPGLAIVGGNVSI